MPDRRRSDRGPRSRPYACPASGSGSPAPHTRPAAQASDRPLRVRLPQAPPRLSRDAARVLLRILLHAAQPPCTSNAAADPADPSPRTHES